MDGENVEAQGGLGEDRAEAPSPRLVGSSQEERSSGSEVEKEEDEVQEQGGGEGGFVGGTAASTLVLDEGEAQCEICSQTGHR